MPWAFLRERALICGGVVVFLAATRLCVALISVVHAPHTLAAGYQVFTDSKASGSGEEGSRYSDAFQLPSGSDHALFPIASVAWGMRRDTRRLGSVPSTDSGAAAPKLFELALDAAGDLNALQSEALFVPAAVSPAEWTTAVVVAGVPGETRTRQLASVLPSQAVTSPRALLQVSALLLASIALCGAWPVWRKHIRTHRRPSAPARVGFAFLSMALATVTAASAQQPVQCAVFTATVTSSQDASGTSSPYLPALVGETIYVTVSYPTPLEQSYGSYRYTQAWAESRLTLPRALFVGSREQSISVVHELLDLPPFFIPRDAVTFFAFRVGGLPLPSTGRATWADVTVSLEGPPGAYLGNDLPSVSTIDLEPFSIGRKVSVQFLQLWESIFLEGSGRVEATITARRACEATTTPSLTFFDGSGVLSPDGIARAGEQVPGDRSLEVQGVAADGVARMLVRVDGAPLTRYEIDVVDEGGRTPEDAPAAVGAVRAVGASFGTGRPTSVEVVTDGDGVAFLQYLSPSDFVRLDVQRHASDIANATGVRLVSMRLRAAGSPEWLTQRAVLVTRPLVVLIHGLHSTPGTWDDVVQHLEGQGFAAAALDWSQDIDSQVQAAVPDSIHWSLARVAYPIRRNSLGLAYNAPRLLTDLSMEIDGYAAGRNPSGKRVAASQADVVGHSTGGLLSRYMALLPAFRDPYENFGEGPIHKFIALAVPFLGSPIANAVLRPENDCTRNLQGVNGGGYAFDSIRIGGQWYDGAVANLRVGDETLSALRQPSALLPQGNIVAVSSERNYAGLPSSMASLPFLVGLSLCPEPLTRSRTQDGWRLWFGTDAAANDGFVGASSAREGGLMTVPDRYLEGVVHGPGTEGTFAWYPTGWNWPYVNSYFLPFPFEFGMNGPHAQELASGGPHAIVEWLNTPVTSDDFRNRRRK